MSESKSPAVMVNADELQALRLDADRYRWLRGRAVRLQGSELWYSGAALDIRTDVGRDHVAEQTQTLYLDDDKEPTS